jgi:hypothetical protein
MRRRKSENTNLLKKYNKMKTISSVIWILSGISILAFGIYYKEIFELIFGILAFFYGLASLRTRRLTSLAAIARSERRRLNFLVICIVVFSLVNPIGNIAVIFDLYKRDYAIKGGFDEK